MLSLLSSVVGWLRNNKHNEYMLLAGTEFNWRNKSYPLLGMCDIDRARDSSYFTCTGLGDTFAFFAMLLCTVSSSNS